MPYCGACGKPLERESDKFCRNCGAPVGAGSAMAKSFQAGERGVTASEKSQAGSSSTGGTGPSRATREPIKEGRIDRQRGLLEGRARNVEGPDEIVQGRFQSVFDPDRIIRFRAELTDSQGNTEYIPVEVACRARKWVGTISEGDKFSAEGKFEKDGILHVKRLYNQTTSSVVGEK